MGTELKGIFSEPPTPRQKENSGECDFTYSQVIWDDLVLLLADDSCTRCSSSLEAICDASWTRGKGDWLVAVSRGPVHSESGKAGVSTLQGLPQAQECLSNQHIVMQWHLDF